MKKNILLVLFLAVCYQSKGQQLINHIFDPSAAAIRGVAIPGKLGAATAFKDEEAKDIIPDIIKEEKENLSKWRKSIFGTANSLNVLAIASRVLIERIDSNRSLILPIQYAPGFKHDLRQFSVIKERAERLEKRALVLVGIGSLFVDGEGYYRVACQKLALEYLEVYADLSKIDFNITKLLAFIELFYRIIITS